MDTMVGAPKTASPDMHAENIATALSWGWNVGSYLHEDNAELPGFPSVVPYNEDISSTFGRVVWLEKRRRGLL